jgi:mRNA interferase RelE/StbE
MALTPKWTIEFDPAAQRELDKLDKPIARRVSKFLYERVAKLDDPHQIGCKAL